MFIVWSTHDLKRAQHVRASFAAVLDRLQQQSFTYNTKQFNSLLLHYKPQVIQMVQGATGLSKKLPSFLHTNFICLVDYTRRGWGVRCHPEGEFRPLLFSQSWTIQGGGEIASVDQVTAAALLKYGQKCTFSMCDFGPILRNRAYYTFSPTE